MKIGNVLISDFFIILLRCIATIWEKSAIFADWSVVFTTPSEEGGI
jgi:hypothetical protein